VISDWSYKITRYVNKLHQNNNKKALFAVANKQKKEHTFVYVSIHMVNLTPDQYLMHAGSHARARTNTFIHPKCRVNNIHCNDRIETLSYYPTQLIYLSHILSLHPPLSNPYTDILSRICAIPIPLPSDGEKKKEREKKKATAHTYMIQSKWPMGLLILW